MPASSRHQRVVVTGLGIVSPIGIGVPTFWESALAGRSGVTAIPGFPELPLEQYRCRIAGQVADFNPTAYVDHPIAERVDRYAQFALVASKEALADAALTITPTVAPRVGVIMGAGMGGMVMGEREITQLYQSQRPNRVHPNFIPTITLNSAAGAVAMATGAKGPNYTISTACSSSAHALGQAMLAIRHGQADAVLAVGADSSITPLVFAGFCSLRALSTAFNDDPTQASRPFDSKRDGFVMGEGAAVLVLESLAHARKRRARIYAEVTGYASTSEAYHMVIPKEDGLEVARTMTLALKDAGLPPSRVDYINAHATSTVVGDAVEVKALRQVFKSRADRLAVSATKSLLGHTLGAAGAIGAVATVLSIRDGIVHPTVNLTDPDPACRLAGLSAQAQRRPIRAAMLNAFGFGSNNAAVVLQQYVP
ncbi:MAG: beta-ketoacyl-ACP synthase II [Nitrospiraceae bacterium]